MSENNLRQTSRNNGRITRGYSDLPKQEPKPESSSEQEQEQSSSPQKTKKIHHMTLKALERKKQREQEMRRNGIDPNDIKPVEKPPPRKRGRPKGSKKIKKEEAEKEEIEVNIQEIIEDEVEVEEVAQRKDITLRKRAQHKKMVEPPSPSPEEVEQPIQEELVKVNIEIKVPANIISEENNEKLEEAPVKPPPKKRGRKKKIQPQAQPAITAEVLGPISSKKLYTIPKAQTYNNYHKYYKNIVESTKQSLQPELPLIFDKISNPQAYKNFISALKS